MSSETVLSLKDLSFAYSSSLLRDVNLEVKRGDVLSLIGPSGAGKTTLLRLIAGELPPSAGAITKHGKWRRVFQGDSLLPWLTVEENIRLGERGTQESLDFAHLIKFLDLGHVLGHYPRELSGGQIQRTEIARALIGKPDGLLLDEPFSSLDYIIRHETRDYLINLLKEYPVTMILVTHDIPEAVAFTKKVCVLNGRPATIIKSYHDMAEANLVEKIWKDLR